MGVSDSVHFAWLDKVVDKNREKVLAGIPESPVVFGLGENKPSLVAERLLASKTVDYRLFDGFPTDPSVQKFDFNRLDRLEGRADIAFAFRSSYFISNKEAFFRDLKTLLRPGAFFLVDFMTGSSRFPVLRFEYKKRKNHAEYADSPAYFESSFFDQKIVEDFSEELDQFVHHARWWPPDSAASYLGKYGLQFFDEWSSQLGVSLETFGSYMREWFTPEKLFSLEDFRRNGFKVIDFSTRYFYPQIHKFHFYSFVVTQYEGA